MITAELVLAFVALLTALGGGMKYVLDRTSTKQRELETKQEAERVRHELKLETERLRWEQLMADQLMELRREIRLQEHEVSHLRVMSNAYLQHIAALEALMRSSGITIPELRLPIYRPLVEDDDSSSEIEGEVESERPRRRRRAS